MDPAAIRDSRAAWEAIAGSFDATRRTPWAPVVEFVQGLPPGSWVLDAGVGNGRHAEPARARGLVVVGLDFSRALLGRALARAPGLHAVQGALEAPPLKPRRFDAAVAVASLHHVRGAQNRLRAWAELLRALKPGAPLLASVWSRDQDRFRALEPSPERPSSVSGHETEPGDVLLRWTQHGLQVPRFVHLYTKGELESEAARAGFALDRAWDARLGREADQLNHFGLFHRPA